MFTYNINYDNRPEVICETMWHVDVTPLLDVTVTNACYSNTPPKVTDCSEILFDSYLDNSGDVVCETLWQCRRDLIN